MSEAVDKWPGWVHGLFGLAVGLCFAIALVAFVAALENKSRIAQVEKDLNALRESVAETRSEFKDAVHEAASTQQAYEANIKSKLALLEERTKDVSSSMRERDHQRESGGGDKSVP